MPAIPHAFDTQAVLSALEALSRQAGDLIMDIYRSDFAVNAKADASPVTLADERAEAHIVAALHALMPGVPVVAEEAAARGQTEALAPGEAMFWLVDPLDGTREFVSRNGEFTVNIALISGAAPLLGVLHIPAQKRTYLGAVGQGAWSIDEGGRRAISCRRLDPRAAVLACSRSHNDEAGMAAWLAAVHPGMALAQRLIVGSSLKFGLLAEGRADLYPRLSRTMEWDTAAGHAVLAAAGGQVLDLQGRPLRYGKPGFENPHFVARGLDALHAA